MLNGLFLGSTANVVDLIGNKLQAASSKQREACSMRPVAKR
jgi:hypothetical protein